MKPSINYVELGRNIKRIRLSMGMSQEKLAEIIGLSATHISNVENGKTKVSLSSLVNIADCFSCSIDTLIKGSIEGSLFMYDSLYLELLSDCSLEEKRLIIEIVKQVKKSYDQIIKPLL